MWISLSSVSQKKKKKKKKKRIQTVLWPRNNYTECFLKPKSSFLDFVGKRSWGCDARIEGVGGLGVWICGVSPHPMDDLHAKVKRKAHHGPTSGRKADKKKAKREHVENLRGRNPKVRSCRLFCFVLQCGWIRMYVVVAMIVL